MAEEKTFPGESPNDADLVDIVPEEAGVSKGTKSQSALGKLFNNLPLLGLGMVISVIGLVAVLIWQTNTTAEQAGYVVFKMTYHPGWQVTANGKPVPTVMLSPALLGFHLGGTGPAQLSTIEDLLSAL